MKIGFSLSPGGLLFPYHIGVLSSLSRQGFVTDHTPLAGSSAGAIAVASHAAGVKPVAALQGCINISEKCAALGGARGHLMPLLEKEMDSILPPDAHDIVNGRNGMVGVAYREIFPRQRSVLATDFDSKDDFIEAVCNSSMFPFFTTNWPCVARLNLQKKESDVVQEQQRDREGIRSGANRTGNRSVIRTGQVNFLPNLSIPRLIVDGYFTVPRERFGCPIFPDESKVERTVTVSVFPHDIVGLSSVTNGEDRICPEIPEEEDVGSFTGRLLREATQESSPEEHISMFERGFCDGERWASDERKRERTRQLVANACCKYEKPMAYSAYKFDGSDLC